MTAGTCSNSQIEKGIIGEGSKRFEDGKWISLDAG